MRGDRGRRASHPWPRPATEDENGPSGWTEAGSHYERCAGLDIHRDTVVASVITREGLELRTFGTVTDELLALADWLLGLGVTQVAMESTGVYWKPFYNLLEATDLGLLVVNARHIKAVPGRKTDVKDAESIADLLRHGLLRGSYILDRPQRELRGSSATDGG